MKNSKNVQRVTLLCLCLLLLSLTAAAQKRRAPRRTTPKPAPTAATTTAAANAAEIRATSNKVSIQIMNVTKFIYTLGGIARSIEDTDKEVVAIRQARRTVDKKLQTVVDKNAQYKQAIIQSIRNLRAGLAALETEFNAKPALRPYVFQIQGTAEDQANGGQLSESGKTLLLVVEKLSNTLAAMP